MKNTTILAIIGIVILVAGAFIYFSSNNAQANVDVNDNSNIDVSNADAQKVTLGIKNYNYYPNTITVKVDKPVEITLDSSVVGCYRSFVVPEFKVNGYSANPSQKITFTPPKTGTFRFQCSMGMGRGTLIVEN
ncbi:cupredoxin domain-containing protein [Candidatus Pacearchaeota archaeon]|nr:cupredoxin domain-containing protein [Candidatus Pacearchaeota archaeon]